MFSRIVSYSVIAGCFLLSFNASATIDSNAAIVQLRKTCTDGGVALHNCFTTSSALVTWITNTRNPTQAAQLKVEIGPGVFDGFGVSFSYVNFIGSGRDKTTIGTTNSSITVNGSTKLHFQDLRLTGGFPAPIYWLGGGSSTWVNVLIEGSTYGWTESNCNLVTKATRPVHKWFSSTIISAGKVAYATQCSENWFYGSEIIATGPGFGDGLRGITARAYYSTDYPETHIYGSVIRVLPSDNASFSEPSASGDGVGVVAIAAGQNAEIHVHGTGIDVLGNNMPNNVAAIAAINGGVVHAAQTAFNMKTASGGSIVRIKNEGGHIHAPYLWEHIPTSPLISANGADITTVTSGTSDGFPHLLIYSTNCASGWYDSVDKNCKL